MWMRVWQSTSRRGKTREAHPKISFAARDRVCNEKCVGYDRKTSDAEGHLVWSEDVGMWGCVDVDVARRRRSSSQDKSQGAGEREADVGSRRLDANRAHDKQNASHTRTHREKSGMPLSSGSN